MIGVRLHRGRPRSERCARGHLLTLSTRRLRVYTRKSDGLTVLMSDGCKRCNADNTARRRAALRQSVEVRP